MPRKAKRDQGDAPFPLSHQHAQKYMMAYLYGRLTHRLNTLMEEHVQSCVQCHEDGLRHIATERVEAMQERAKSYRRSPQPLIIVLSGIAVLLLCVGGLLIYGGAHRSSFLSPLKNNQSANNATASVTPTATILPVTPVELKAGTPVGGKGIVSIARSPDGKLIAAGANPATLGGSGNGGVTIYGNAAPLHVVGFDSYPAPGTLAWSSDSKLLAGGGHLSLYLWHADTGTKQALITLPTDPGASLYVFDTTTGTTVGTYPVALFATTGFVQWGDNGSLSAAPANAANATNNIPAAPQPIMALWSGQQGTRIFRDKTNTTLIGCNDEDRKDHAAMIRWSPDNKYIIWGYPSLPVSSTLLASQTPTPATPGATTTVRAIGAPNAAFAKLVINVGAATNAAAYAIVWPSTDGTQMAVYDASDSTNTPQKAFTILDAAHGTALGTITSTFTPATIVLNMLTWQSTSPIKFMATPGNGPATDFTAGS